MKSKLVVAGLFVLLLSLPSFAQEAPQCVKGTLASYIALGETGCMFGNALYHEFSYVAATGNAPRPDLIVVTPVPEPITPNTFVGLNFSSAYWVVGSGISQQSTISYAVVPFPPAGSTNTGQLTLDLGPSKVNGIVGSVTISENTNVGDLQVYDKCNEVCTIKTTDQLAFTPLQIVNISDDISLSGGTAGASFSLFANNTNFVAQ